MEIPSDRETSPDWLRSFQTPLKDFATLSSSSASSSMLQQKRKRNFEDDDSNEEVVSAKPLQRNRARVLDVDSDADKSGEDERALSIMPKSKGTRSDSLGNRESHQKSSAKAEEDVEMQDIFQSPIGGFPKTEMDSTENFQSPIGEMPKIEEKVDEAAPEEDTAEVQERRSKRVLSSLPLVLGDKVHRSKILLECEGDALDLSGDVGAVGRVCVSGNSNDDFLLDLKGIIYKATIVPSNTFFVVNIGQTEAKVEAIMNDFVQLQPSSNVFESETMIEGTLEGFGFESDDDKEYIPAADDVAKPGVDSKDEKNQPKQKSLKTPKGPIKKIGKSKTKATKAAGKTGSTRKTTKKTNSQKRSGK